MGSEHKNTMYSHSTPIYLDVDLSAFEPRYIQHSSETQPSPNRQRKINRQSALLPSANFVELEGFRPENIRINMNRRGKVCVRANREITVDHGRNGTRKEMSNIEQSFQLPAYLVENNWLDKVITRFEQERLVFVYPKKPDFTCVPIDFDDE